MSVKTTAIVIGRVARIDSREVTIKQGPNAGDKLTFTNLLIIGNDTLADVQLGRDLGLPKSGDLIAGRVAISVYRDDDQMVLEQYLDPATIMAAK